MSNHTEFVFIQDWNEIFLDKEDGGQAFIYHISDDDIPELFVRLQSWDETKKHKYFNELIRGKKLKITIEALG